MVVLPAASRPTFIRWDQVAFTKERRVNGTMRMPEQQVRIENVE